MNALQEFTERFIKIQNRYDGGREYSWSEASRNLDRLEGDIHRAILNSRFRTDWTRRLAFILKETVAQESARVWNLYIAKEIQK